MRAFWDGPGWGSNYKLSKGWKRPVRPFLILAFNFVNVRRVSCKGRAAWLEFIDIAPPWMKRMHTVKRCSLPPHDTSHNITFPLHTFLCSSWRKCFLFSGCQSWFSSDYPYYYCTAEPWVYFFTRKDMCLSEDILFNLNLCVLLTGPHDSHCYLNNKQLSYFLHYQRWFLVITAVLFCSQSGFLFHSWCVAHWYSSFSSLQLLIHYLSALFAESLEPMVCSN